MIRPETSWDALRRPGKASNFFEFGVAPRFDPAGPEFRAENALLLAELCRVIYRHGPREREGARPPFRAEYVARAGMRETRFFDGGAARAALVEPDDGAESAFEVLVFRGTLGRRAILADLDARVDRWPAGGRVHSGFRRALDSIAGEIETALAGRSQPVFFTGHSLGAALATLAAGLLPAAAVYTFGSPRAGDAEFGRSLGATPVYRIVNGADVFTRVPPPGWPYGFRHVGTRIVLSCRGFRPSRRPTDPPVALADHAPVNYVANLERLVRGDPVQVRVPDEEDRSEEEHA
jgi:hypothetical protein